MSRTAKSFIKIGTAVVSVLLLTMVAFPAFARPAQVASTGKWLGVCGPQSVLNDAAQVLGISLEELRQAVASGKTVGQVAQEKGVSVEELVNRIVEIRKAQIDAQVANGTLTEQQAQAILSNFKDRVKLAVDAICPGYCGGCYGGCGNRSFSGAGFGGCGSRARFQNGGNSISGVSVRAAIK